MEYVYTIAYKHLGGEGVGEADKLLGFEGGAGIFLFLGKAPKFFWGFLEGAEMVLVFQARSRNVFGAVTKILEIS